jgi:hypothetical protein
VDSSGSRNMAIVRGLEAVPRRCPHRRSCPPQSPTSAAKGKMPTLDPPVEGVEAGFQAQAGVAPPFDLGHKNSLAGME